MAQYDWYWCKACQGLWYIKAGYGECPARGTGHLAEGSLNYHLDFGGPMPGQQDNWRWCNKCQGLFFAGFATSGYCPSATYSFGGFELHAVVFTGGHDYTGSLDYVIPYASQSPPGSQSGWHWCCKCQGLFYAGNPTSGACPAGGGHDHTGSVGYALNHG